VGKKDGPLYGFAGRVEDKSPVSIVTSTDIAAGGTLPTHRSFLVALGECQRMDSVRSRDW